MYILSGFTDFPEALYHPVFLIGFLYRENGGFPGGSDGNRSACDGGDLGLIPGSGRSPGGANGSPLAPHSSVLGWRIPWTEEPGGLQSMGLQRVRHN